MIQLNPIQLKNNFFIKFKKRWSLFFNSFRGSSRLGRPIITPTDELTMQSDFVGKTYYQYLQIIPTVSLFRIYKPDQYPPLNCASTNKIQPTFTTIEFTMQCAYKGETSKKKKSINLAICRIIGFIDKDSSSGCV